MKALTRALLGIYVLTLLWLTLFKLSYDIGSVIADYGQRSLNLIPFAGLQHTGLSETVSNVVVFVPLGLLLAMNAKKTALWRLVVVVLIFSVAVESVQYALAIGTSDVTDVITNTGGGLVGAALYRLLSKAVKAAVLDRIILVIGISLFVAFLLLRVLVFRVRY